MITTIEVATVTAERLPRRKEDTTPAEMAPDHDTKVEAGIRTADASVMVVATIGEVTRRTERVG